MKPLLPVTTTSFQLLRRKKPVGGSGAPRPGFLNVLLPITAYYYKLLPLLRHYYQLCLGRSNGKMVYYYQLLRYYYRLLDLVMSSNGSNTYLT